MSTQPPNSPPPPAAPVPPGTVPPAAGVEAPLPPPPTAPAPLPGTEMAEGGEIGAKKFNYVEIGLMAGLVCVLCIMGVYYYKRAKQSKQFTDNQVKTEKRLGDVEAKIKSINLPGGRYATTGLGI